jgi:DNA-binding NarL/FixJ family response regulator
VPLKEGPVSEATEVGLSPCAERILVAAVEGGSCCSKSIAARLGLRPATVDTYFSSILQALDAPSRADAVLVALRRGLVTSEFAGRPQRSDERQGPDGE